MDCPRCGTPMSGGVCPECGFPINCCSLKSSFNVVHTSSSRLLKVMSIIIAACMLVTLAACGTTV